MTPPILLVTGGSGYIGRHILRHATGWSVHATYFTQPLDLPATWHPLDVRDPHAVDSLIDTLRPTVIVHTAYQWNTPAMPEVIVDGTRHVATAAARVRARLVHLSTDVVFDGRRGMYTERDTPNPLHAYGECKLAAEKIVAQLIPDRVIARTSLVYGFDPMDPRTAWVIDAARARTPLNLFTDELRSPIHVDDLAYALLELAANRFRGILHVAGPQPLSRYDFGVRLCRARGVDPSSITAALAAASGLVRPLDCTLSTALASQVLATPLRSVDDALTP